MRAHLPAGFVIADSRAKQHPAFEALKVHRDIASDSPKIGEYPGRIRCAKDNGPVKDAAAIEMGGADAGDSRGTHFAIVA